MYEQPSVILFIIFFRKTVKMLLKQITGRDQKVLQF